MADYYTMLTTKGLAKVVAALSGGPALQPQSMAVGDGGGPNFYDQYDRDALKQRSSLVNQHWSDDLNLVDVDPNNPAWVVTEGLIPTQVGGWYIREVGIFDIAGDLIAIGVYPETYKPIATAVEADLLVRSILEVGEASVVQLKIDPSQVMATRAWVLESAIPHALTMLDDAVERAEVARDIAQLAVGIFNSEQAGITATSDDDYFWVSLQNEESLVALYKNEGGVADFYGAYPSHKAFELVRQRLEVVQGMAGLAGGLRSGLYKDEEDSPLYGITTKSGQYLAAWDRQGYQINPARKGLIRKDDDPVFSIKNENGIDLYAIDENRQPIVPLIKALYTSDDQPTYAKVDKKGIIFHGIDPTGKKMVGGGDFDSLEINERSASDGELYLNYDQVKKRRDYSSPFFNAFPLEALPDLATWYGYYDSLMENNPDYITRVLLDTDSVGNPIYAYEFTPPDLRKSVSYPIPDNATRLPSIVIVSGTHGIEKTGAFVSLQFAHDLCNSWHSDELARTFRFGVKVVFVPCMVPYGCQENVRKNPNGVDANRNAPAEWGESGSTDPTDDMYIGPAPGSEIETQVAMSLPDSYPNAFLYIDLHNHTRLDVSTFASWVGARGARERLILGKVGRDLTGYIRSEFPYLTDDIQVPINQVSDSGGGFIATYWSVEKNVPGIYFESVTSLASEFGIYRQDALKFNNKNFRSTIKAFYDQHLVDELGGLQ